MDDRLVLVGLGGAALCMGGLILSNISTPIENKMVPNTSRYSRRIYKFPRSRSYRNSSYRNSLK